MLSYKTRCETVVFSSLDSLYRTVADQIAALVREKPDAVLGLPTGTTPLGIYRELIRMHYEDGLDFSSVTTFNLDEYYPMEPTDPQSYHHFMETHFFHKVHCRRVFIPDGRMSSEQMLRQDCAEYERRIEEAGGIDLQLLGIGRNGHIGFNEPGSSASSRTRLVTLDPITRQDAVSSFGDLDSVPVQAITMGIGAILEAHRIIVVACGAHKAEIVHQALEGPVTLNVPATILQEHVNTAFYLDEAAAGRLSA